MAETQTEPVFTFTVREGEGDKLNASLEFRDGVSPDQAIVHLKQAVLGLLQVGTEFGCRIGVSFEDFLTAGSED